MAQTRRSRCRSIPARRLDSNCRPSDRNFGSGPLHFHRSRNFDSGHDLEYRYGPIEGVWKENAMNTSQLGRWVIVALIVLTGAAAPSLLAQSQGNLGAVAPENLAEPRAQPA